MTTADTQDFISRNLYKLSLIRGDIGYLHVHVAHSLLKVLLGNPSFSKGFYQHLPLPNILEHTQVLVENRKKLQNCQ